MVLVVVYVRLCFLNGTPDLMASMISLKPFINIFHYFIFILIFYLFIYIYIYIYTAQTVIKYIPVKSYIAAASALYTPIQPNSIANTSTRSNAS